MRTYPFVLGVVMMAVVACNSSNTASSSNNAAAQDSAAAAISDTATAGMNKTATTNDSLAANSLPSATFAVDTSDAPVAALAGATSFRLDTIHGIPDFIQGCSDGSAASEKDLEMEKYVFVSDGQSMGMLKINGTRVYLRADLSQAHEENTSNVTYIGHGFTLRLTLAHQESHEASDSFTYDGVLVLEKDGKQVVKMKIWGGGAC